jgi:hypothetical protein
MAPVLISEVGATLMTLNENPNILMDDRSSKYMQFLLLKFFSIVQNNKMLAM